MNDQEFIEAIEDRLDTNGWQRGRIGRIDTCNCLLGAAGFVEHGEDLVVDKEGVHPVTLDGEELDVNGETPLYELVPGMVRLAKLMGFGKAGSVVGLNDGSSSKDEVIVRMHRRLDDTKSSEGK